MSKEKIFFSLTMCAAIIYVALLPGVYPFPFSFALKAVPVLSLSVLVALNLRGPERIIALLALLFCVTGDILFDLDRVANFKAGLGAFLTGHIFYVILFLRRRSFDKGKLPWIIGIVVFAIAMAIILRGIDRELLIPVMAYITVITMMTIGAFIREPFSAIVAAGAMVFFISDVIIAVNKFLQPIPYSTVYNISLYFTAQILIVKGLLREENTL